MKVRKTFKRLMSLLLCAAMVMTTLDLSALTLRANETDVTSISDDGIVTISGDDAITIGGEDDSSDSISDNDMENSVSDDDVSDENDEDVSVSDNSISDNYVDEITPLTANSSIVFGDYKITGDSISESDFELKGIFGSDSDKCLLIKTNEDILIEMKNGVESTHTPISVSEDIEEINITIKNINIDYSDGDNAFQALIYAPDCALNLTLEGTNILKSNGYAACPAISSVYADSLGGANASLSIGGEGTIIFENCNYAICHTDLSITGGNFKFVDCTYDFGTDGALSNYEISITGGSFNTGDIRYQTVGTKSYKKPYNYRDAGLPVAYGYQLVETDNEDFPYEVVEATSELRVFDYIISADDDSILEMGKDFYPEKNTEDEILIINTVKPVTIKMADGVDATNVPIKIAEQELTYNITIDGLVIDYSDVLTGVIAIDAQYAGLNLTLLGDNVFIGNKSVNSSALRAGYNGYYSNYPDGELTINGTGSLSMEGYYYGITYNTLIIKGGKIKTDNDIWYTFNNNAYDKGSTTIIGGYFSVGDVEKSTVGKGITAKTDKNIGMTVASGYMVVESGDEDFPYKVIATPVKIASFDLNETTQTVYLKSAGDEYGEDWIDGVGGRSSAFLLLVSNIKDVNGNDVSFEDANIGFTSLNPTIAEVTNDGVVHGLSVGTAKIEISAGYGSDIYTQTCTVTVKQGSIDVLQEEWVKNPETNNWEPTGEIIVVNSFGNLVEANEWITTDWGYQYEDWKEDTNPDKDSIYCPATYTIKVYKAQTITTSNAGALNYTFIRDGVSENANGYITFDLNKQTWTASAPITLNNCATFVDGTINANKGISVIATGKHRTYYDNKDDLEKNYIEGATVFLGSEEQPLNVTASELTVGMYSNVITNGNFKVTGTTTLGSDATIVDNQSVVLNIVNLGIGITGYHEWVDYSEDPKGVFKYSYEDQRDEMSFIARYSDAILEINGTVNSKGNQYLVVGIASAKTDYFDDSFDNDDPNKLICDITKDTQLFKSSNASFITTYVRPWLPENSVSEYGIAYYDKNDKWVHAGTLSYTVENVTNKTHVDFANWSDVADYIAAINDANSEYCVTFKNEEVTVLSNFKFPKAASCITFRSDLDAGTKIYYSSDLTLTTDTYFENLDFVRVQVVSGVPKEIGPYTLTKVDIAGHYFATRGNVTFNTPVNFTDNKKTGTLCVENGNLLTGYVNVGEDEQYQDGTHQLYLENRAIAKWHDGGYEYSSSYGTIIIAGQISDIGNVEIYDNQLLVVTDYMTGSDTNWKFNAPVFTPVNLNIDGGTVVVANENAPYFKNQTTNTVFTENMKTAVAALTTNAVATVTNTYVYGTFVADEMNLTNVVLDDATVESKGTFNITGILTSKCADNVLVTCNDSKTGIPFLNVSGSVIAENNDFEDTAIQVYNKSVTTFSGTEATDSILLVTKNGNIEQFVPYFDSVEGTVTTNLPESCYSDVDNPATYSDCAISVENIKGYYLKKTGDNIYVIKGDEVSVVLAKLDCSEFDDDDYANALDYAYSTGCVLGYYSTWADAVVEINNRKDPTAIYTMILLRSVGGDSNDDKPITLNFPTASCLSELIVTGAEGQTNKIYYTNGLTLTSKTKFKNITLAPVKAVGNNATVKDYQGNSHKTTANGAGYIGTDLAINTAGYDFTWDNVKFGAVNTAFYADNFSNPIPGHISTITGNGKNTVTFSNGFCYLSKGISNVGTLIVNNSNLAIQNGDIKANQVTAEGVGTVIGIEKGSITATTLLLDKAGCLLENGNLSVKEMILLESEGFTGVQALGNITVSEYLSMNGNATIFSYGTCTLKNISIENGSNVIACPPGKLKITGTLNTDGNKLKIADLEQEFSVTGLSATELTGAQAGGYKVTPTAANLIANIGTVPTELLTYGVYGDEGFTALCELDNHENDVIVKYNGGLYYVDATAAPFKNSVVKMSKEAPDQSLYDGSYYLDWNEAVKEINSINNPDAMYAIEVLPLTVGGVLEDTCVTDASANGKLTLPGAKKCYTLFVMYDRKSSNDEKPVITFTDTTLSLNTDVAIQGNSYLYEGIELKPISGKVSFSLGRNSLCLWNVQMAEGCTVTDVKGNGFKDISSFAVYYSEPDDKKFEITGNIDNVKYLSIWNVNFVAYGKINVGVVTGDDEATLTGTANVTAKNGEIASITSNITVATGNISNKANGKKLNIELLVKNGNEYKPINDNGYTNYDEFAEDKGIPLAKATYADTTDISYVYTAKDADENPQGIYIKKNENIIYVNKDYVPYQLCYENNTVPCLTFADAVTEINNINDKTKDYTLYLVPADQNGEVNLGSPEALTMPASGKLKSLTIKPAPKDAEGNAFAGSVNLYYGTKNGAKINAVAKFAFAADTTIVNVNFIDAEVYAAERVEGNYANRAPLNISLGGKDVTVKNVTFEGRGVIIDGGKTGNIIIDEFVAGKNVVKLKNDYPGYNVIEGEIKNLNKLTVGSSQKMLMKQYFSSAAANATKKEAKFVASNIELNANILQIEGSISLVNVSTVEESSEKSVIFAEKSFDITGTVISRNDDLVLLGCQKSTKDTTPYINISGVVSEDSCPIAVGVVSMENGKIVAKEPTLNNPLSLLTAPKCSAIQFITVVNNTVEENNATVKYVDLDNVQTKGFTPSENQYNRGIGIIKKKNLINAYNGYVFHIALAKVDDMSVWAPTTGDDIVGYFSTLDETMEAINDKNANFLIILLDDIKTKRDGSYTTKISIPNKTKAAAIGFQGSKGYVCSVLGLKELSITNDIYIHNCVVEVSSKVTSTKGTTLNLVNTSVLLGYGTITLENVVNYNWGQINYSVSDTQSLTINGTVINKTANDLFLIINAFDGKEEWLNERFLVEDISDIGKDKTKELLNAPKVSTGDVDIMVKYKEHMNETPSAKDEMQNVIYNNTLVKAGDAIYYVDKKYASQFVAIKTGDGNFKGCYLDMNQAFMQIKALADSKGIYTVIPYGDISDTNVLDKIPHSKLEFPGNNMAGSIEIFGNVNDNGGYSITYSGDISAFVAAGGNLTFNDVTLNNVNPSTGDAVTTGKITLNRNSADKTGYVTLYLDNVLYSDSLGAIAGTKGVTNVNLNTDITLTTGFSNINELTIDDGLWVKTLKSDTGIGTITFNAGAAYESVSTVVDNINIAANCTPYIYTAGGDKFKINKYVNAANENAALIISLASNQYDNVNLVYAPLADASVFKSDPAGVPVATYEKLVSYKSGNYVRVGNVDNMTVKIEGVYETAAGDEMNLSSYAANYKEAVDMINTWKNKDADYVVTLLKDNTYYATGKDNAYAAFLTPSSGNAKSVTIKGQSLDTLFRYTGAVKPSVDVTFEDVTLDCGKVDKNEWIHMCETALDLSSASIDLGNSRTYLDEWTINNVANNPDFFITSIKGNKGALTLRDCNVYISDTISMGTLKVDGDVDIKYIASANNPSLKNYTIAAIEGIGGTDDHLYIDAPIGTAPMLKITGTITGLDEDSGSEGLMLRPLKKDAMGAIRYYTKQELDDMLITGAEKSNELTKKRIADISKAPTEMVAVLDISSNYYIADSTKIGGFVYLTDDSYISVNVSDGKGYISNFITFADAVADIEKLADKTADYEIEIIDNQICEVNCWRFAPYTAVTLPKTAHSVTIIGNGDAICTTSTSLTVSVPTVFKDVSFVSVKQTYTNAVTGYYYTENPTLMSYSISDKASLTFDTCGQDNTPVKVNKITGDTLILKNCSVMNTAAGLTVKNLELDNSNLHSSAKTTFTVQNELVLNCNPRFHTQYLG